MSEERPECIATTKAGARCKNRAQPNSDYCHIHRKLAAAETSPSAITAAPEPTTAPAVSSPTDLGSSRAKFEILAGELNALAAELQRTVPAYLPPAFTRDGLVELLKYNLDKFTPNIQLEIVTELRQNLEGTSPQDLVDPDTWKGLWYILNYMAQEQSSAMLEKLYGKLSTIPGMALLSDIKGNLEGTSPKEFLDPDTWKGMWLIMSYSVQATASDIKHKLAGEDENEDENQEEG